MRRQLIILVLTMLLLVSCASKPQPAVPSTIVVVQPSATSAVFSTLSPTPTKVEVKTPTEATPKQSNVTSTETHEEPGPGCTVVSYLPEPAASLFPPVTEKDWVHGPITASVTLIEYGDFQ